MTTPAAARKQLRAHALKHPGAWADEPWPGDHVAKVGKRIFVFLGAAGRSEPGMTVKLRESHAGALGVKGAKPSGYGLGKSGWIDIPFGPDAPPLAVRDLREVHVGQVPDIDRGHRVVDALCGYFRCVGWWARPGIVGGYAGSFGFSLLPGAPDQFICLEA